MVDDPQSDIELYTQHRKALVDYAAPIVGDRSRAEDVVQEAWLRLSGATERETIHNRLSFLYRVVRNLAIDLSRRLKREVTGEAADEVLEGATTQAADPEHVVVQRDQLVALLAALDELPERMREAFRLHRFEDRSYAEIAKRLGVSQGQAYSLVQTAVIHCMERLMSK